MNNFSPAGKRRAFTLIEMMIVMAILAVLTAVIVGFALNVRRTSQDMVCLHNLRQISTGLMMFQQEHHEIPMAEPPLAETLAPYLSEPKVFICPASRHATADSYSKFYVPRPADQPGGFLIGCANHGDTGMFPGGFGNGKTIPGKIVPVVWNGKPVNAGDEVKGGTLQFIDGTEVAVDPNLTVVVLTSFNEDGGKTYSAIKIPEGAIGSVQVNAAHGTRFDIVTPACTAGVRGTKFSVNISETSKMFQTAITVTDGTVGVDSFWPETHQTALGATEASVYEYPKEPSFKITGPTFAGRYVFYKITNVDEKKMYLKDLSLKWPTLNRRVDEIRMDSALLSSLHCHTSPLTQSWTATAVAREISPQATKTISFKFEKIASTNSQSYGLEAGAEIIE